MSTGWSIWVMFLVVLNMGITFFLFLWAPHAKIPTVEDGTTGHVWAHGAVREGLHRLPRWWIITSGTMFVSAFIYLIFYPGFGGNPGLLKWSAHGQMAKAVARNDKVLVPLLARIKATPVETLVHDAPVLQLGDRVFQDNCAACHQRSATGNLPVGAPDLTDGDWLYGGDATTIVASITHGRGGVMPAWAGLGEDTVNNLTEYVLGLSGQAHDAVMAAKAKAIFTTTCAACHGATGTGNHAIGAPNLADAIWLHGGSKAEIHATIHDGRQGQMPNWDKRLTEEQIKAVATYVYAISDRSDAPAE